MWRQFQVSRNRPLASFRRLLQTLHHQQFIPALIDHLHDNLLNTLKSGCHTLLFPCRAAAGLHQAPHPLPVRNERGEDRGEGKPIKTHLLSPALSSIQWRRGEIEELDAALERLLDNVHGKQASGAAPTGLLAGCDPLATIRPLLRSCRIVIAGQETH